MGGGGEKERENLEMRLQRNIGAIRDQEVLSVGRHADFILVTREGLCRRV